MTTAQTFGRYEIKSQLGRGGMATVYLAHDPRFGRDVALKVLPPQFLHDDQFRTRFEREARTIAMLEHKAIVPVYDFGEHDGQPYLVMRHMTGGTLEDRVRKGPPLTPEETVKIVKRIASALDAAHSKGIVHRDLKPGNVLFDQDGDAYLSDFGIVKVTEATANLTGNSIVGTPAYMSPEQVHGKQDVDGRSDIYTLGVILYELLVGKTPYGGDTPTQVMMAHVLEPVPDLAAAKENLPPALNQIVQMAMAKDVNQRYRTAGDMGIALEKAFTGSFTRPAMGMDATMMAVDPMMSTTPMPRMPLTAESLTPAPAADFSFNPGGGSTAATGSGSYTPPPGSVTGPQPAGKAKWALWGCGAPVVIGLAIIGLCVVVGTIGAVYVGSLIEPTPTAEVVAVVETPLPTNEPEEPTAEPATAEPTVEPTAVPTKTPPAPTEVPPTPTQEPAVVLNEPPVGTMLYKTDFNRLGVWPDGIIEDADDPAVVGAEIAATEGVYEFAAYSPETFFWVTSGQDFGAAVYQVEATTVDGPLDNAFGMLFMVDNTLDTFYRFEISSDGYMRIARCDGGCSEAEFLYEDGWSSTDAINQGLGETNVLKATAEDGQLDFYINGIRVAQVKDDTYTSGDIGLFVNTQSEGDVIIHFDNFYVVEP